MEFISQVLNIGKVFLYSLTMTNIGNTIPLQLGILCGVFLGRSAKHQSKRIKETLQFSTQMNKCQMRDLTPFSQKRRRDSSTNTCDVARNLAQTALVSAPPPAYQMVADQDFPAPLTHSSGTCSSFFFLRRMRAGRRLLSTR